MTIQGKGKRLPGAGSPPPKPEEPPGGEGNRTAFLAICLALALMQGTPPGHAAPAGGTPPADTRIVWPAPPLPARIEYVRSISSESDLKGRKPGRRTLGEVLLGKGPDRLVRPVALASNEAGLMVIADPAIPTVHFIQTEKRKFRRLKPKVASSLRSPVGVAVGADGRAYVTDSAEGVVFVFGKNGKIAARWGEGVLERPTGIALDEPRNRLYVVDTLTPKVFLFDLDGRIVKSFGERGAGAGQFNYPTHIAISPKGDICVSDSLNFRVQIFGAEGDFKTSIGRAGDGGGEFARPKGVAFDGAGRVYVADAAFENVQIFSPEGTYLLDFGGPGTGPGEFTLPAGLFRDAGNRIWVADSFNQRVQAFLPLEVPE